MANFALRQPLVVESLRACLVAPKPFCELQGSQKYVFVPAYHHGRRLRAVCACTLQELCKNSWLPPVINPHFQYKIMMFRLVPGLRGSQASRVWSQDAQGMWTCRCIV